MKNEFRFLSKLILAAALLFIIPNSYAQNISQGIINADVPSDENFKDWIKLTAYMRSEGIEPVYVKWEQIEPLCLGIKETGNEVPYNKCKYRMARDSFQHQANRNMCEARARGIYPVRNNNSPQTTITKRGPDGAIVRITKTSNISYSRKQLDSLRYGIVSDCMFELGWNSADNWKMGRNN